jgi:hypothetical protein
MAGMDRGISLSLAHAIVERTRDYTDDALNDLLRAMDDIEQARGLIPQLIESEEAAVAVAEEKLARGERLPEFELRGPVEDFLPEPNSSVLAHRAAGDGAGFHIRHNLAAHRYRRAAASSNSRADRGAQTPPAGA